MKYEVQRIGEKKPIVFNSKKEVAKFLGISVKDVDKYLKTGELAYSKQKQKQEFTKENFEAALKDLKTLTRKYNLLKKKYDKLIK